LTIWFLAKRAVSTPRVALQGHQSRDEALFPPKSYRDEPKEGEEEKGYSHNQL